MPSLLEIRPAAVAEAQRLCPELLRAQLVRLDDGTWLDVLTWSRPDGEQRLMARAAGFDAITKMHDLLVDVEEPLRGEIIDAGPRPPASMYRLALRFLGHPDDAQDACQEILVRIVTHLGSFEGRSKFTTWAYTVAVRSLLRTRRRLVESSVQGAEAFAAFLDAGMGEVDPTLEEVEYRLLCEEVRISCTYGMLLCILDRDRLPLARHAREEVRVWVEPVARQLDAVVAIGDLYRFDRFAAPARLRRCRLS